VRPYSSVASLGDAASICSPSASSPDRGRTTISDSLPNMMSPGSVGIPGILPICNSLLCSGVKYQLPFTEQLRMWGVGIGGDIAKRVAVVQVILVV